ncbi:pyruvate decarboxylase-2 [Actinidia rufa]|uniref:Pyruvate decarboxylase-2 n=1 Tax=Actinidia rufa TaxID=165716 RepID=A0A7J0EWU1_9ERIC|nr:pyruvate decarboxylase-2 [Actinidia rufa]
MEKTLSSLQQPTRVSLGSVIRWSNKARWKSPGTEKTSVTPIWIRRRAPADHSRDLDLSFLIAIAVARCRLRCSSPFPSLIDVSTSLAGLLVRERERLSWRGWGVGYVKSRSFLGKSYPNYTMTPSGF